jgi:hypothetical protein|nr:MAG TPA: hypothetical protein [Caudoviricetes sp.]
MLRYENVTFLRDPVKQLSRQKFIALHLNVFWMDRDESTRRKMLGEVYDLIKGPKKTRK